MSNERSVWPQLQPGDRVSTAQKFELIRVIHCASGQADLYLARLVRPKMFLKSHTVVDWLLQLLGEPRWLVRRARLFVLKVAKPTRRHNLAREFRFLSMIQVDHPHLISLYAHPELPPTERGTERGLWPVRVQLEQGEKVVETAALALEYLAGGSLNQLLEIYGDRLPPGLAIEITLQVAVALQSMHDQKIIHQDLSPGNIMLRYQLTRLWAKTPEVVVIDLGVADALKADERFGRGPYGKQIYLAPERAESPYLLHPAADVFSLGAIMYRMLAGRPDSQKTSSNRTGIWERTTFPSLQQQVPQLSPGLCELVMRALDLDWKVRPTLAELGAALRILPEARQSRKALGGWRRVDQLTATVMATCGLLVLMFMLSIVWSEPSVKRTSPTVTPLASTVLPTRSMPTPIPGVTATAER